MYTISFSLKVTDGDQSSADYSLEDLEVIIDIGDVEMEVWDDLIVVRGTILRWKEK